MIARLGYLFPALITFLLTFMWYENWTAMGIAPIHIVPASLERKLPKFPSYGR